jgi:hypothetical protein
MSELFKRLRAFQAKEEMTGKGALSVMLVVTDYAKEMGLPLQADQLTTTGGGQVLGLGKSKVQSILKRHGITKVLATEGGRTSRGSLGYMQTYVKFLNELHAKKLADLDSIEAWWIEKAREFFDAGGFVLNFDAAKSLRAMVEDLLAQAEKVQSKRKGAMFAGAMLQHMVGAKLELALGKSLEHHGSSVADSSTKRDGDYALDDVIIHVTVTPSEGLIQKCAANLKNGKRPIIVTTEPGVAGAVSLAKIAAIADRVDVVDAGQFIAMNLYELSGFSAATRRATVHAFVKRYNEIVIEHETDPALKIAAEK